MKKSLLLLLVLFLVLPLSPQAQSDLSSRNEVFDFLKEAFQVQVSLSEKLRTKEEIRNLLSLYFSDPYQKMFWDENVVEEAEGYLTYGTDFALYYIPFYQYLNETKVIIRSESIYVLEYFPEEDEGPVTYDSHYEGLLLTKIEGKWRVDKYLYDENIPKSILAEAYGTTKQKITLFSTMNIWHLFY